MSKVRRALGAWGERTAEAHLRVNGIIVIDRNWRRRDGEIDLIAVDGDAVVFCEVKTRRGTIFGTGVEAITGLKARRLRRLAAAWLAEHRCHALAEHGCHVDEIRFDVVTVTPVRHGDPLVDHLKGAF
jgi:putative endonuclease